MAEIAWDLELLEMIRDHLERISQYLQEHVNVLTRIQEQANGVNLLRLVFLISSTRTMTSSEQ